jgi:hypothetical protein
MPRGSFGYVPTPAIVAPIEFTLPRDLYLRLGGHAADIASLADVLHATAGKARVEPWPQHNPWPLGTEDTP